MPTNDFLPFALDSGANVLAQADYSALTARSTGFTAGTARSAELNKVWRQAAFAVSSIAQFMADYTGSDVLDDGNSANFKALFTKAVALLSMGTDYAADTGAANTYVAAFTPAVTKLVDGMVLRFKAANANTGAATFNPNGLGARSIVTNAGAALSAGMIQANGDVWLQYNTSIGAGSWVILAGQNFGNAALATVMTSLSDDTAGRLMPVGAFGLGSKVHPIYTGDLNSIVSTRFDYVSDTCANNPSGEFASLLTQSGDLEGTIATQLLIPIKDGLK